MLVCPGPSLCVALHGVSLSAGQLQQLMTPAATGRPLLEASRGPWLLLAAVELLLLLLLAAGPQGAAAGPIRGWASKQL